MIRSMILTTRQLGFSSCCSSILILSSSSTLSRTSSFSFHSSRNLQTLLTVNSRIRSRSLLPVGTSFTFRSMTTHSTNNDESNSNSNSKTTNYDDVESSTKNNILQEQQQGEDEIYNFDDEKTIRTVLTETRTIAMIGASNKPHRDSYHVMEFLIKECNYTVIPINPMFADGTTILSQKVYTSLYDVLQLYKIDMIDIFRRSSEVKDIINELIHYKNDNIIQQQQDNTTTNTPLLHVPKYIWMQINVIDYESAKLAQQNGFIVIMNKCPLQEISKFNIQLPIV